MLALSLLLLRPQSHLDSAYTSTSLRPILIPAGILGWRDYLPATNESDPYNDEGTRLDKTRNLQDEVWGHCQGDYSVCAFL